MLSLFGLGILKLDDNLQIIDADPSCLAILNCQHEDLLKLPLEDLISTQDPRGISLFHKQLSMYSGRAIDVYPIQLAVHNTLYFCRMRIHQEKSNWCVLIEKVSDNNNVFHIIKKNELKWKAVTLGSSSGIVLLSEQDKLLEFNPAFFEMMVFRSQHGITISEEALYMQDFFSLFQADMVKEMQTHIETWIKHRNKERFVIDGWYQKKFISVEMSPLYFDSSYSGCILIIEDHTTDREIETLNIEVESQRARSLETAKMAALGEMAAGIAHEVNTPLATIHTTAGQLKELVVEEPMDRSLVSEMVATIETTAERIAKIILSMRSFSRNSTHDLLTSESVQKIIDETLVLCAEKFKNHNVKLVVPALKSELRIQCRANEVSQVLLNLLNNALDAVESVNPDNKWVKLDVAVHDEMVEVSVADGGPGIPVEVQARIFQPFFTTKGVGKGTGLGLSISKRIAKAHGGDLYFDESCPHTRFILKVKRESK